jgi:hypothetical protein
MSWVEYNVGLSWVEFEYKNSKYLCWFTWEGIGHIRSIQNTCVCVCVCVCVYVCAHVCVCISLSLSLTVFVVSSTGDVWVQASSQTWNRGSLYSHPHSHLWPSCCRRLVLSTAPTRTPPPLLLGPGLKLCSKKLVAVTSLWHGVAHFKTPITRTKRTRQENLLNLSKTVICHYTCPPRILIPENYTVHPRAKTSEFIYCNLLDKNTSIGRLVVSFVASLRTHPFFLKKIICFYLM